MGIVVTKYTDSIEVDLGGLSADRTKARIRIDAIRSIVADTDGECVEVVFTNGEINKFNYQVVDEVNGDPDMTSQTKLYNAMVSIIFTL